MTSAKYFVRTLTYAKLASYPFDGKIMSRDYDPVEFLRTLVIFTLEPK